MISENKQKSLMERITESVVNLKDKPNERKKIIDDLLDGKNEGGKTTKKLLNRVVNRLVPKNIVDFSSTKLAGETVSFRFYIEAEGGLIYNNMKIRSDYVKSFGFDKSSEFLDSLDFSSIKLYVKKPNRGLEFTKIIYSSPLVYIPTIPQENKISLPKDFKPINYRDYVSSKGFITIPSKSETIISIVDKTQKKIKKYFPESTIEMVEFNFNNENFSLFIPGAATGTIVCSVSNSIVEAIEFLQDFYTKNSTLSNEVLLYITSDFFEKSTYPKELNKKLDFINKMVEPEKLMNPDIDGEIKANKEKVKNLERDLEVLNNLMEEINGKIVAAENNKADKISDNQIVTEEELKNIEDLKSEYSTYVKNLNIIETEINKLKIKIADNEKSARSVIESIKNVYQNTISYKFNFLLTDLCYTNSITEKLTDEELNFAFKILKKIKSRINSVFSLCKKLLLKGGDDEDYANFLFFYSFGFDYDVIDERERSIIPLAIINICKKNSSIETNLIKTFISNVFDCVSLSSNERKFNMELIEGDFNALVSFCIKYSKINKDRMLDSLLNDASLVKSDNGRSIISIVEKEGSNLGLEYNDYKAIFDKSVANRNDFLILKKEEIRIENNNNEEKELSLTADTIKKSRELIGDLKKKKVKEISGDQYRNMTLVEDEFKKEFVNVNGELFRRIPLDQNKKMLSRKKYAN